MRAITYCLSAAAGALALGLATLPVEAAPAGAATVDLKGAAETSVEKASHRRCWWHRGHRHCRYYGYRYHPYYYGYGPSIRFYWGGHRHRHHWRHRHW